MKVAKPLESVIHGAKVVCDLGRQLSGGQMRWFCKIECPMCGEARDVEVAHARRGHVRCVSCGNTRHGLARTKLYQIWSNMHKRCANPKVERYALYGGRGITICDAWHDPAVFSEWAAASGYRDGLTLDRIDNDGNYEPSNCRWTTQTVQNRNTRRLYAHNTSGHRGVSRDHSRWRAQIFVDNRPVYLGSFLTAVDAARAYDRYVTENGLEHTLNFPRSHMLARGTGRLIP